MLLHKHWRSSKNIEMQQKKKRRNVYFSPECAAQALPVDDPDSLSALQHRYLTDVTHVLESVVNQERLKVERDTRKDGRNLEGARRESEREATSARLEQEKLERLEQQERNEQACLVREKDARRECEERKEKSRCVYEAAQAQERQEKEEKETREETSRLEDKKLNTKDKTNTTSKKNREQATARLGGTDDTYDTDYDTGYEYEATQEREHQEKEETKEREAREETARLEYEVLTEATQGLETDGASGRREPTHVPGDATEATCMPTDTPATAPKPGKQQGKKGTQQGKKGKKGREGKGASNEPQIRSTKKDCAKKDGAKDG